MIQQFYFWEYIQKRIKTLTWKGFCTSMFIAALFTTAKTWKQPKCPLRDEWVKELSYLCREILFSNRKQGKTTICGNIDGPWRHFTKLSQTEQKKKKNKKPNLYDLTCGIQKQNENQTTIQTNTNSKGDQIGYWSQWVREERIERN